MEQPDGCDDSWKLDLVCKAHAALYDLKQAPHKWHEKMDQFLNSKRGFETARRDPCMYIMRDPESFMIVELYVDKMLLTSSNMQAIAWMNAELDKCFDAKGPVEAKVCIGLGISENR